MESLVNLAKKGRTIVFSIHQPRSNIFAQFDKLLLHEGRVAYAGNYLLLLLLLVFIYLFIFYKKIFCNLN